MEIVLDGALMTDRTVLHNLLEEQFALPDYYGRNLDALYDLLSTYPKQVRITVIHEEQLILCLGNYGKSFLRTLRDSVSANSNLKISISDEII